MFQQPITIAGRTVSAAYCYATEIAFGDLAGRDINEFFPEAVQALRDNRMPDPKSVILLILSAVIAAARADGKEAELTDTDLMYQATPEELGTALGTVIGLRARFYRLPPADERQAEKETEAKGDSQGNA